MAFTSPISHPAVLRELARRKWIEADAAHLAEADLKKHGLKPEVHIQEVYFPEINAESPIRLTTIYYSHERYPDDRKSKVLGIATAKPEGATGWTYHPLTQKGRQQILDQINSPGWRDSPPKIKGRFLIPRPPAFSDDRRPRTPRR